MRLYMVIGALAVSTMTVGCCNQKERLAQHILTIQNELSLVYWCSQDNASNIFKIADATIQGPGASIQLQTQDDVQLTISPPVAEGTSISPSFGKTKSKTITLNLVVDTNNKSKPANLKCSSLYEFEWSNVVYQLKQQDKKWLHRLKGEGEDKWKEGLPWEEKSTSNATKQQ